MSLDALIDITGRVVFLPVRHHSPAAARVVRELARRMRPDAVLIEGPADFNDRMAELALPHRLPLAIYSYVRLPDGRRRGAFYPLCIYSPEWQALEAAREVGAVARFIDLPWADIARDDTLTNRYADAELRRGAYVARLCRQLGLDNFDSLWDLLAELDPALTVEEYFKRCHHFCLHTRLLEDQVRPSDCRREAFMAGQVRQALAEFSGKVLVVTGGYHSSALYARLNNWAIPGTSDPVEYEPQLPGKDAETGIALTPYSYERLDSLAGYEAGMPNPGFYHQVWQDRQAGIGATHRRLLARVVESLRKRGQQISAADLIAAETTAQALARLRGHTDIWRRDLVDGITGALIKEELSYGIVHPMLAAVHEVFRGGERGQLAEGTSLPPLVQDLRKVLAELDLEAQPQPREVELDLIALANRPRSRIMHRLRILGVAGYERIGGTDLAKRDDLSRIWERWRLRWSPDFDATSIEAARYGTTLAEATAACLTERAAKLERDAAGAALLLLDASLAGLPTLADAFRARLAELVRGDGDFFSTTQALGHLLYLYRYDVVLETTGGEDLGGLVAETFTRGLWLLESLGQLAGKDKELLAGIRTLLDTFEACGTSLGLNRAEFVDVLRRLSQDGSQSPLARGAAMGVLWTIGEADAGSVQAELLRFADAAKLGDFLTGLFCLARETVQRHPDLVLSIDRLLKAYADEEFLTALPALRLAFTYFTPREKHHMALTLVEALGLRDVQPLTALEVGVEVAAGALAIEARLFAAVERYGLRGNQKPSERST